MFPARPQLAKRWQRAIQRRNVVPTLYNVFSILATKNMRLIPSDCFCQYLSLWSFSFWWLRWSILLSIVIVKIQFQFSFWKNWRINEYFEINFVIPFSFELNQISFLIYTILLRKKQIWSLIILILKKNWPFKIYLNSKATKILHLGYTKSNRLNLK